MVSKTTLVNHVKSKNFEEAKKNFLIKLVEEGVITSEEVIDNCIHDEFFNELFVDYMGAKYPSKCPKCGGKLRYLGGDQYKCRWCGAGVGVDGAAPPQGDLMGMDLGESLLKCFLFLLFLLILIAYSIISFLLNAFDWTIFAILAAITAITFLIFVFAPKK